MGRKRLPLADRFTAGQTVDWSDRFWRQVAPEALSGCWLWTGALRKTDGYGHFNIYVRPGETEAHLAHRYSLEQQLGRPLDDGENALHRCDNRACVNPAHLFSGTVRENHYDAMAKGRHCHGSKHGRAKITEADVESIRASEETATALAARFGVTKTTVCDIRKRKIWRHV